VGFGAALNQAWRSSDARYLAALNDDALPDPGWLQALVSALENRPQAGMAASQVRLSEDRLDSAALVIGVDGSSKQRGHGEPPEHYSSIEETLAPSGSAALYRRTMLEETGGFDESFFLYCEDTDLALRAQWLGWRCVYVPEAVVEHQYSASAGRASALKAYLVERNRLRLVVKDFPISWLLRAPFASLARYVWHLSALWRGEGKAAAFRESGEPAWKLMWFVLKAHGALLLSLPGLLRERRRLIRRISTSAMRELLRRHSVSMHEVALH
jgi:GT2 family glycosyltransferase